MVGAGPGRLVELGETERLIHIVQRLLGISLGVLVMLGQLHQRNQGVRPSFVAQDGPRLRGLVAQLLPFL
jgi:hypothetical protein